MSEPSPPAGPERLEVAGADIVGIRAANPGPLSLSGTNSWIVGRDPAWLVDPGPDLVSHLDALDAELARRGGLGGIAATHDHADHVEGLGAMRARHPGAPVAAARGPADVRMADGDRFGPLLALATPGHAVDHLAFAAGDAVLTGDAVLGEGSVFIHAAGGGLTAYLEALQRLAALRPRVLCPGHGPVITDAQAKLEEYRAHRLAREAALVAALNAGSRTIEELLDAAWADVPQQLRPVAAVTLGAHLDKLERDGRLPAGVQRPEQPPWLDSAH